MSVRKKTTGPALFSIVFQWKLIDANPLNFLGIVQNSAKWAETANSQLRSRRKRVPLIVSRHACGGSGREGAGRGGAAGSPGEMGRRSAAYFTGAARAPKPSQLTVPSACGQSS